LLENTLRTATNIASRKDAKARMMPDSACRFRTQCGS